MARPAAEANKAILLLLPCSWLILHNYLKKILVIKTYKHTAVELRSLYTITFDTIRYDAVYATIEWITYVWPTLNNPRVYPFCRTWPKRKVTKKKLKIRKTD